MSTAVRSHVIPVRTASTSYEVVLGHGLLSSVGERLAELTHGSRDRAIIVTSPEIFEPWGEQLLSGFPQAPLVLTIPSGEAHKRLATLEELAEQMVAAGATRDTVLIAFGGGVIGDMTGFLAAAYMRGIRYVGVPTTLLAQVDSSLGGKTGVNLAAGKNLFGAFHHPLAVFADVDTLTTLPPAQLRAGLQEAVKAGIIRDAELFTFLENHSEEVLAGDREALTQVVAASVRVKAEVVEADERESGLRMILNLGHTLGHAIEAATEYKQLLHGEAVAWGMLAAIRLAADRALVSSEQVRRMERTIRLYGPLQRFEADVEPLVALTAKDKKNRGGARSFVLPVGIGDATVVKDVTPADLSRITEGIVAEALTLSRPVSLSSAL